MMTEGYGGDDGHNNIAMTDAAMPAAIEPLVVKVARKMCELEGLSPDAMVMHGFKSMTALESRIPRAKAIIPIIRGFDRSDFMLIYQKGVADGRDADEWKNAVDDWCTHTLMTTADSFASPKDAITAIVAMEQRIALDPSVSKEARDLVQSGRDAERDDVVDWLICLDTGGTHLLAQNIAANAHRSK